MFALLPPFTLRVVVGPEMPAIATIDSTKLYMYANDHPPPHFHAFFAEHRAVFDVETLKLIRGGLPAPKRRAIVQWAKPRRARLLHAWNVTQAHRLPGVVR
jgi:hypothetical protein